MEIYYRRLANDGDYGFNRQGSMIRKQYASKKNHEPPPFSFNEVAVGHLKTRLRALIEETRSLNLLSDSSSNSSNSNVVAVMGDELCAKAVELCKEVYDVHRIDTLRSSSSSSSPSPQQHRHAEEVTDAICLFAAHVSSLVSSVEEKCKIFVGVPEGVSLLRRRLTVHNKSHLSASLLFKSKVVNETIKKRKMSTSSSKESVDFIKNRFAHHVPRPFRPSTMVRFGSSAHEDEMEMSLGGVNGTLSASNTHAKMMMHFLKVACNEGYRNSLDLVNNTTTKETLIKSGARALLRAVYDETVATDAAILYGNRTDCDAIRDLIKDSEESIIPGDYTRDIESTPYFENKFVINIEQLVCDMMFGSDWDVHLKDHLSKFGYEVNPGHDDEKIVFKNEKVKDNANLALILVSNLIKIISRQEFDKLERDNVDYHQNEHTNYHTSSCTLRDNIKMVVECIYKEIYGRTTKEETENNESDTKKNLFEKMCDLIEDNNNISSNNSNNDDEKNEKLKETMVITANLLFSKIVDSLHILRNNDISRVCYSVTITNFSPSTMICWDATNRRVVSVSTASCLKNEYNGDAIDPTSSPSDTTTTLSSTLSEIYGQKIKNRMKGKRFFNYLDFYKAVSPEVDTDGDPPIKHRFSDINRRIIYENKQKEEKVAVTTTVPATAAAAAATAVADIASSASSSFHSSYRMAKISARVFFSGLRDALETGAFRGVSRDVETTLKAMSDDTKLLQTAKAEEIELKELVYSSLTNEKAASNLIMKLDKHGIETAAFKEGEGSVISVMQDLKGNKVKFSKVMERLSVDVNAAASARGARSLDAEFAREMEAQYPEGAIQRWQDKITDIEKKIPSKQMEKLSEIEKKLIKEEELNIRLIEESVNDTELAKATDSVLHKSLSGGVKVLAGRFVAITITGTVIGVLGVATSNVIRASRGAHYNVKDSATGKIKSYKIFQFSRYSHDDAGDGYITQHPFEEDIDNKIESDSAGFNQTEGSFVFERPNSTSHSVFRANATVCGRRDKNSGLCERWAQYWSGSVVSGVKPMSDLAKGTSLTCDKGMNVSEAVAEVLGSVAEKIIKEVLDAIVDVAREAAEGLFDFVINSPAFIVGVPLAVGVTSTGLNFANWKRGVAMMISALVLMLMVRFFVGSGFLTMKLFRNDNNNNINTQKKRNARIPQNLNLFNNKNKIIGGRDDGGGGDGDDTDAGQEIQHDSIINQHDIKNFELVRPLFGPAKPTQEMTYFHVGLAF